MSEMFLKIERKEKDNGKERGGEEKTCTHTQARTLKNACQQELCLRCETNDMAKNGQKDKE